VATNVVEKWSMQELPPMNDRQFQQWRELLEHRIGMQVTDQRRHFLQTSLGMRMREIGCPDYQSYYNSVVDGTKGLIEWATLVDRLTVQETRFFRDMQGFKLVKEYLQTRKRKNASPNLWSVGCATGEEPYSLSIVAKEALAGEAGENNYSVTATDISQPALNKAREGVFGERKLEQLDQRLRDKYFRHAGNQYQVTDELKERVCFIRMNVLDLDKLPLKDFDVIYCQNVLIYFRRWRRKEIANYLADRLVPGGLLVFGTGELVDWQPPGLTRIPNDQTQAYLKRKG